MGTPVWIRDDDQVWRRAIMDRSQMGFHDNGVEVLPATDGDHLEEDVTTLEYIHEASILETLNARYNRGKCYTFIGRVLVSVNPMICVEEPSHLAGKKMVLSIPHPFSVAENSFQQMERESISQCIVISGESGSGKSEACKRVIKHLVMRSSESCNVDEQLLAASPILESFGNAATVSNSNSSRFGKFLNIVFDERGGFLHASVQTYLLERSRVSHSSERERGFHVFYQMLAGADQSMMKKLKLKDYNGPYLSKLKKEEDQRRFEELVKSMEAFGMDNHLQTQVFCVVAAVLHLNCILFHDKETNEGNIATVDKASQNFLTSAANLLEVEESSLFRLICEKKMTLRGETMISQRSAGAAEQARDAFAKSLYEKLFAWLVNQINGGLGSLTGNSEQSTTCIGILDIFGFECFERNSFEQFLINFANEALQTTFNHQIFQAELRLYKDEGLDLSGVEEPPNNTCFDCLSLFTNRPSGLLSVIDAVSVGPEPSNQKLIDNFHRTFRGEPCFMSPHPRIANSAFIVRHYAGSVQYFIDGFIEKNVDRLPQEADEFIEISSKSDTLVAMLKSGQKATKEMRKRKSIATSFGEQMQELIGILNSAQCSFIRCVKPNAKLCPNDGFERKFVIKQMNCLSIPQTARLLQSALPGRMRYVDLFQVLKGVVPQGIVSRFPFFKRIVVESVLRAMGLTAQKCKFGSTRVFFGCEALSEFHANLRKVESSEMELPCDLSERIEIACVFHIVRRKLLLAGMFRHRRWHLKKRKTHREESAKQIQKILRGSRRRREYLKFRSAILGIQHSYRGRSFGFVQNQAIIRIQAFWRGYATRGKFRKLRQSIALIQVLWRDKTAVFHYSATDDNDTVSSGSSSASELASAWEARLQLQEDEEAYSRYRKGEFEKHSPKPEDDDFDALVSDAELVITQYDDDDDEEEEVLEHRFISMHVKRKSQSSVDSAGYHGDVEIHLDVEEEKEDDEDVNDYDENDLYHETVLHEDGKRIKVHSLHALRASQRNMPRHRKESSGSNKKLTSMLLQLTPDAENDQDFGSFSKNHHGVSPPLLSITGSYESFENQEGTFARIVDEFAASFSKKHGNPQLLRSESSRNVLKRLSFSSIFRIKNREERLVVRKLKHGMKKKHYRQVIEALVRARNLGISCPEVVAAEEMVVRVKQVQAQSVLREAMVMADVVALRQAIEHATKLGMASDHHSSEIIQQARNMLCTIITTTTKPKHEPVKSA